MPEKDRERIGAIKYSCLSTWGPKKEFMELLDEYKAYFSNETNNLKNLTVKAYEERKLDLVYPLLQEQEGFEQSPFLLPVQVGRTVLNVQNYINDTKTMYEMFNRNFDHIHQLCDSDQMFENRFNPAGKFDAEMLRKIDQKEIGRIPADMNRD